MGTTTFKTACLLVLATTLASPLAATKGDVDQVMGQGGLQQVKVKDLDLAATLRADSKQIGVGGQAGRDRPAGKTAGRKPALTAALAARSRATRSPRSRTRSA